MTAGRIDIDEYGERSARITAAKTRGELAKLFADLPAPHPVLAGVAPPPASESQPTAASGPAPSPHAAVAQPGGWSPAQRTTAAFVPLVWIAAIALIATGTIGWGIIFVPIVLTAVGRGLWGRDWDGSDHPGDRHRRHRIEHRELRADARDEFRRRRYDR
jgi:hypothetical protein